MPRGSQIELLNVMAQVAKRDDGSGGYVLVFEDHKEQIKVFIPMGPEDYRRWVTAMYEELSKLVIADVVALPGAKLNGH